MRWKVSLATPKTTMSSLIWWWNLNIFNFTYKWTIFNLQEENELKSLTGIVEPVNKTGSVFKITEQDRATIPSSVGTDSFVFFLGLLFN